MPAKTKGDKAETTIAIGDQVRIPIEVQNAYAGYRIPTHGRSQPTEPVEGLVCSIRHVPTGKLVKAAKGDMNEYVFEILHSRTFNPRFASDRNVGGSRTPRLVQEYEAWVTVRKMLRERATKGELLSDARGELARQALAGVLDGWQLVKMRTPEVESLEEAVSGPTPRVLPEAEEPAERELMEEPDRRI
jgi:hypothetical protein